MNDMNRWTFAASLFFSISIFGSAFEAVQGSALLAGAGNPQAVQRSLTDFVGRMGGASADMPEAPAAAGAAIMEMKKGPSEEPSEPLAPMASWLLSQGKDKALNATVAKALGFADSIAVKQKAYKAGDDLFHIAQVRVENGSDMVFGQLTSGQIGYIWRTDRTGKLLVTVRNSTTTGTIQVPNTEAEGEFEREKAFFLDQVPPANVATTGAGTN
jgi:hypothetical protein